VPGPQSIQPPGCLKPHPCRTPRTPIQASRRFRQHNQDLVSATTHGHCRTPPAEHARLQGRRRAFVGRFSDTAHASVSSQARVAGFALISGLV
jgi:hypothetical protein